MNSKTFSMVLMATLFVLFTTILSYAIVDKTIPWHPLQQITIKPDSDISIDENENGKIDKYRTEETLQSITENGAKTNKSITFKNSVTFTDLTSSKSITINKNEISGNTLKIKDGAEVANGLTTDRLVVTSSTTLRNEVKLPEISNCGKLYTDASGKVICGNDQVNDADHSTTNEIISSISMNVDSSNKLTLTIIEGGQTHTASVTLPVSSGSGSSGSSSAGVDIVTVRKTESPRCTSPNDVYETAYASCPSGYKLISCNLVLSGVSVSDLSIEGGDIPIDKMYNIKVISDHVNNRCKTSYSCGSYWSSVGSIGAEAICAAGGGSSSSSSGSIPTLSQVLAAGNDAGAYGILGLNYLEFDGGVRLIPTTVNGISGIRLSNNARGLTTPNGKVTLWEDSYGGHVYVSGEVKSDSVKANNELCIGTDCITSWSQVGGGGSSSTSLGTLNYEFCSSSSGNNYCYLSYYYPEYFCYLRSTYTGGCDRGAGCTVGTYGNRWYILAINRGDCDEAVTCSAYCFKAN